jgi:hypothetical protein
MGFPLFNYYVMSKQSSAIIIELPTTKEKTFVSVSLAYTKGGMNYFTSKLEARGYYLHVRPEEISRNSGFVCRSSMAFSGTKQLVKETKRFSAKVFQELLSSPSYDHLVEHVLQKNSLVLTS